MDCRHFEMMHVSNPNADLAPCREPLTKFENDKRPFWGDKNFRQSGYWAYKNQSHWVDAEPETWRCRCIITLGMAFNTHKRDTKKHEAPWCNDERPGEWQDWKKKARDEHERLRECIRDIRKNLRTKGGMPEFESLLFELWVFLKRCEDQEKLERVEDTEAAEARFRRSSSQSRMSASKAVEWQDGWAKKQGKNIANWKRRYFVRSKDGLKYYTSDPKLPDPSTHKGEILLATASGASSVLKTQENINGVIVYWLSIKTKKRTWYLRLEDDSVRDEWVRRIRPLCGLTRRRLAPGETFLEHLRLVRPYRDSPVLTRLLEKIREAND